MKQYETPELEISSLMTQENIAGPSDFLHTDEEEGEWED